MRTALLLPLLAACGNKNDPSGIWLLTIPYEEDSADCDPDYDENFNDGQWPDEEVEEDSEWTYTDEASYGDTLMFAQVETSAPDQAVMVLGSVILPGAWMPNKKMWEFNWAEVSNYEEGEEHDSGYEYSVRSNSQSKMTLTLNLLEDQNAKGEFTSTVVDGTYYSESDEWSSRDTNVSYGSIPADSYLEPVEDAFYVENGPEQDDCDGDTCRLSWSTECASSGQYTAVRTDYVDEDAYEHLQDLSQGGASE